MGMGGNGKPPQWEWELPALPREFIPTYFFAAFINIVTCMCLNLKYEAEPDRERENSENSQYFDGQTSICIPDPQQQLAEIIDLAASSTVIARPTTPSSVHVSLQLH